MCGYCQSTVVREGEVLRRLGKMAELFADYSPLQLLASGRWQNRGFMVVGRLQYKYGDATWSEWQVAFDDGGSGTLAEDNGAFVFTVPATVQKELPEAAYLRVGATTAVNGKSYSVSFNESVALFSAEGELDHLPPLGTPFPMVELRSETGEVLSVDYSSMPPQLSSGRSVQLDDLALKGLKDESAREDKGREFSCPNCGAPVSVVLTTSKSIVCGSCGSIIDIAQGIGGELRHAEQDEPVKLLIPLGSIGQLQGVKWQVVGFQHRSGNEPGDDEHFGWSEYLLFNTRRGFTFLVDAGDGWSVVKPTTGAPSLSSGGQGASYLGNKYQRQYAYNAQTTYVAGEFYWPVERGAQSFNTDFSSGKNLLSMEKTAREVTWSSGMRIEGEAVAKAFGMDERKDLFKREDAAPVSSSAGLGCGTIIFLVILVIVLLVGMRACSSCDPRTQNCGTGGGARSSGGSWGGYSTGGGHK